jgi:hypothetical protein
MFKNKFFLMDQAAGDGGDGGGAPAPAAAPAPASVMASAAAAAPASPAAPAAPAPAGDFIPEKYRVTKEGTDELDIEASARKLAESYSHLEKRLGAGDVPPKSAEEYATTVPDALKDTLDLENDELFKGFRKEAHEAGLTQKQFDFVMGKYFGIAPGLVNGAAELSAQDATAELRKIWPDEASFNAGASGADRAVRAFANPGADDQIGSYVRVEKKFGNDPDFLALMANIGKETREDMPPAGSIMPDADVDALQKSEAYWKADHPDHATTKAKVDAHYARKFASAPKR